MIVCSKCGADIVYIDRWFKKCANGHIMAASAREKQQYEKEHGVEK